LHNTTQDAIRTAHILNRGIQHVQQPLSLVPLLPNMFREQRVLRLRRLQPRVE
jgi:hypothetical protein